MNRKQYPDMYGKTQKGSRKQGRKKPSPSAKEFVKSFKRALGQTPKTTKKRKK